jgi:hypothetical protein
MFRRLAVCLAFGIVATAPLGASAHSFRKEDGPDRGAAIEACMALRSDASAALIDVVADGLGDYLVWIRDGEGSIWACDASGYGDVFVDVRLGDDLLHGRGASLVHLVSDRGWESPSILAERACGVVDKGRKLTLITTVADGRQGYLVWFATSDGDYLMCNASADGNVFIFEQIDTPIGDGAIG